MTDAPAGRVACREEGPNGDAAGYKGVRNDGHALDTSLITGLQRGTWAYTADTMDDAGAFKPRQESDSGTSASEYRRWEDKQETRRRETETEVVEEEKRRREQRQGQRWGGRRKGKRAGARDGTLKELPVASCQLPVASQQPTQ